MDKNLKLKRNDERKRLINFNYNLSQITGEHTCSNAQIPIIHSDAP